MAKWGEGDPRWIVEERADATNVNNWHWTEKNATPWSKDKLKELLIGLKIENEEFSAKIKDLTKCDGEASANNRKAKLIFFYEWVITGEWEASLKNSENKTVYKGTFEITNLSEENDPKDVEVIIDVKDNKQYKLKDFMRSQGAKLIRDQLTKYIQMLKEEFSQGLILPTKDSSAAPKTSVTSPNATGVKLNSTTPEAGKKAEANGASKLAVKKLVLNEEFKCRVEELYNTFVDVNMVRAFTHNSISIYEPKLGGKFSLFDANISGEFIEMVQNKKLVMNWRNKRWPEGCYSLAVLDFNEKDDCTVLALTQTGIPENFLDNTEEGWKNFYFNSIKQTFGFGSRIF